MLEPNATAASINSRVLTSSVIALAKRAYGVHFEDGIRQERSSRNSASVIEAKANATTSSGKTRTMSTTRMATSSVAFAKALPENAPTSVPRTPEISTETVVIANEYRHARYEARQERHRCPDGQFPEDAPGSEVPASRPATGRLGSYGVSMGANAATSAIAANVSNGSAATPCMPRALNIAGKGALMVLSERPSPARLSHSQSPSSQPYRPVRRMAGFRKTYAMSVAVFTQTAIAAHRHSDFLGSTAYR